MKDIFQKIKNLKNLPFLTLIFCFFVAYYWIKIYRFSHPFPKGEFYGILFLQFCFGFIPNFISRKTGRIFVAAGAMILVRLSSHANTGFDIATLNGLFFGAISGICFREIFLEYLGRRDSALSSKETDFFRRLLVLNPPPASKKNIFLDIQFAIIFFLMTLTFERFITYFNAPYLKGFGILETMYMPGISSKTAFALSMKTIDSLIFPLLYFFCEERTSPQMSAPQAHWLTGISIGLTVNLLVVFSQAFYSLKIFTGNTNLSVSADRTTGLFRDSGSSSWIIPTLLFLFAWRILTKKGEWRISTKGIVLIGLFLIAILAGLKQGRAYWIIFLLTFFAISLILIYGKIKNKILKASFFPALLFIIVLYVFIMIVLGNILNPNSAISRIGSHLELILLEGADIQSAWMQIDQNRVTFSIIALDVFSENIFFGNGVGSFILALNDKFFTAGKSFSIVDSAPSLYLGLLSEIGLVGTLVVVLWVVNSLIGRRSKLQILFLLLPCLIGYQVVHPDGAFVAIFLILAVSPTVTEYRKLEIVSVILILGFSVFFILNSMFAINKEEKGPDFRRAKLKMYQLSAYEKNNLAKKANYNVNYHVFKGKTAWSVKGGPDLAITVFLDKSTSKQSITQRWSLLDENWEEIESKNIRVSQKYFYSFQLSNRTNSKYIQVEELDKKGNILKYGEIPFCLLAPQFNGKNQFQSLK